jgi:Fe-S-cluster containining protein
MRGDTSELEGKSFSCIEGCAMCCLYQPELAEGEVDTFLGREDLASGLTNEHANGTVTEKPTAIRLKGGRGSCFFLRDRRCAIFDLRPGICRQFPIHIHVLDRFQMSANLSCRGIVGDGGDSLLRYGESAVSEIPAETLDKALVAARGRMLEFFELCKRNGNYQDPARLVSAGKSLLPLLARPEGFGKLLAFASGEPRIGDMQVDELVALVERTREAADLDRTANEANYEQFELDNIAWLPVYVDDGLRWNIFRSRDGTIEWMELSENGEVRLLERVDLQEMGLLPREPSCLEAFADYARLLVGRDQFRGYVYHLCAREGYRHDLMTVFLGALGTTLLDLWWRTSLVGRLQGRKKVDKWLALEGIRAFDMDCLGAPTIGAFL